MTMSKNISIYIFFLSFNIMYWRLVEYLSLHVFVLYFFYFFACSYLLKCVWIFFHNGFFPMDLVFLFLPFKLFPLAIFVTLYIRSCISCFCKNSVIRKKKTNIEGKIKKNIYKCMCMCVCGCGLFVWIQNRFFCCHRRNCTQPNIPISFPSNTKKKEK